MVRVRCVCARTLEYPLRVSLFAAPGIFHCFTTKIKKCVNVCGAWCGCGCIPVTGEFVVAACVVAAIIAPLKHNNEEVVVPFLTIFCETK